MTAETGVVSFPTPLYQNVAIEPQFYQPSRFVISGVTLGPTTLIQTTINHNYVIGQEVRLLIPSNFGCYQLNDLTGFVLSIPNPNQVIVSIDSVVNVSPFISATVTTASPQILAIGDVNTGVTNTQGRINNITSVPGSFINISPQ
jgi:hypothetical protein